jgi:hypothetical protein
MMEKAKFRANLIEELHGSHPCTHGALELSENHCAALEFPEYPHAALELAKLFSRCPDATSPQKATWTFDTPFWAR